MITRVVVVVPAANEEALIASCLEALSRARTRLAGTHPHVACEVTVVLDDCRDASAAIVSTFPGVRTIAVDLRSVGRARAAGSTAALRGVGRLDTVWTAHTDADSEVPPGWLSRHVLAADAGADLLLGTVVPSPDLAAPIQSAWRARHVLADGHRHVHGANLGIRAAMLEAVGGWPEWRTGEDVGLAERVALAGGVIDRSPAGPVRTSARAHGRAPEGFAAYLRALAVEELPA